MMGVPYTQDDIARCDRAAKTQAAEIAAKVVGGGGPKNLEDKQVIALVAYLDRLGKDLFATPPEPAKPAAGAVAKASP